MQRMGLQQGAARNLSKKFQCQPHNLPWHSAVTLRLNEDWFDSERTVIADAGFGSYTNALELLKHGLHSQMIVKQATKYYPMKAIEAWDA